MSDQSNLPEEELDIDIAEDAREAELIEAELEFLEYKVELAGGEADLNLIETQFSDMLFVYKTHITNGLTVEATMNHIYDAYEHDSLLPLDRTDIDQLFILYFKSIGFNPDVWLKRGE